MLYSHQGNVHIHGPGSAINGYNQDLLLVAAGLTSDVIVEGNITLESGGDYAEPAQLRLTAGRDVIIRNPAIDGDPSGRIAVRRGTTVGADEVTATAGRDATISQATVNATRGGIDIQAKRHIRITDSSQLTALFQSNAYLTLIANQGNVEVLNSLLNTAGPLEISSNQGNITLTNTTASADVFKAYTLGNSGWITIGGTTIGGTTINADTAITLYAEGAGNAGVRFVGDTTLNSPSVAIAGRTVQIDNGRRVEAPGTVNVYTENGLFNKPGSGNFTRSGTPTAPTVGSFGSRPPR
jgi:hypothetical protein